MASVVQSSSAPPPSTLGGRNLKFIVAGGVIALAVAYLVVMGVQGAAVYFLSVSELQAKGPAAQNQLYRVSGNLVPGTLARDSTGLGIHFLIADPNSNPLPVVYRGGQVPDIIGDNIEIVAEGKLDAQGTFTANNVLAKCPSRLENAPPEEHDYQAS
ncbi:MAG: cytochrome c maturation protein CcmE [Chloroflexota bacterium]|nr:cytochrome c maturation protein CcmE [Chloroflexota bacterium]